MPIPGNDDNLLVTLAMFSTYLNNPVVLTDDRATMILSLAQTLCESVVTPLPAGAEIVVLDVASRAYANPAGGASGSAFYAEGEGPFSDATPGVSGGGLWLTQENKAMLRRLAGSGGAFTIDTTPAGAGTSLPWWDTGQTFSPGFS